MKEIKIEGMAGSDDERQCTKSLPLTVQLVSYHGENVTEQEGISATCFLTVHASKSPSLNMSGESPCTARSDMNNFEHSREQGHGQMEGDGTGPVQRRGQGEGPVWWNPPPPCGEND